VIGPLLEEFALRVEYPNLLGFAVAHELLSICGDYDAVRPPGLAGSIARLPLEGSRSLVENSALHLAVADRNGAVALGFDGGGRSDALEKHRRKWLSQASQARS
jgi:hypothetical protein